MVIPLMTKPIVDTHNQIRTWVYSDSTRKRTAQVVMIVLFLYGSQRLYKKKRTQAAIGYAGGAALWVNKDLFDLKNLAEQNTALTENVQNLTTQNQSLDEEINKLKQLNVVGGKTLEELQKEIKTLEGVRNALQEEIKKLQESNTQLSKNSTFLAEQLNTLSNMLPQQNPNPTA